MRIVYPPLALLLVAMLCGSALAQTNAVPSNTRDIEGQARLGGQPAPAGLTVTLQVVSGKYVTSAGDPPVARAVTDAKGRFSFDHLEQIGAHEGREFFALGAQWPGYTPAFQVVDLTLVARETVTLDLTKQDSPKTDSSSSSLGAASPRRSANPQAQQHLDAAQELLFRKHDPQSAIDELKQATKADPWYAPGYILLGLANMQIERWGPAQLAFSEATKVEPGNTQAYLGLGSALNEQHDYEGAKKALEYALKLSPDSAEAHYELARTFASQEKWALAEPHVRRALEINPDYSGPHVLMGNIYLGQGDLASARKEFQEYLRLDPDGALAQAARQAVAEIDKALTAQKAR